MSKTSNTMNLARSLILPIALLLTACGSLVYKQDIQQGNVLDDEAVAELETGMTKRQVQVLLGTPSIHSPFHQNRWDYMNTYAPRGGKAEKRVLTLYFENGALASMEGSYLDEKSMAGDALDRLRDSEEAPIQDLDSLREEERGGPGT